MNLHRIRVNEVRKNITINKKSEMDKDEKKMNKTFWKKKRRPHSRKKIDMEKLV